jgi:hypothetical protein
MPKVSFRMASASREWVFGVQTNTARKIHRSDHNVAACTALSIRRHFQINRVAPPVRRDPWL